MTNLRLVRHCIPGYRTSVASYKNAKPTSSCPEELRQERRPLVSLSRDQLAGREVMVSKRHLVSEVAKLKDTTNLIGDVPHEFTNSLGGLNLSEQRKYGQLMPR